MDRKAVLRFVTEEHRIYISIVYIKGHILHTLRNFIIKERHDRESITTYHYDLR